MVGLTDLPRDILFKIFHRLCPWRLRALVLTCEDLKRAVDEYELKFKACLKASRIRREYRILLFLADRAPPKFRPQLQGDQENQYRQIFVALMDACELILANTKQFHGCRSDSFCQSSWESYLAIFIQESSIEDLSDLYHGKRSLGSCLRRAGFSLKPEALMSAGADLKVNEVLAYYDRLCQGVVFRAESQMGVRK